MGMKGLSSMKFDNLPDRYDDPQPFEVVTAVYHDGSTEECRFEMLDPIYEWDDVTDIRDLPRRTFAADGSLVPIQIGLNGLRRESL